MLTAPLDDASCREVELPGWMRRPSHSNARHAKEGMELDAGSLGCEVQAGEAADPLGALRRAAAKTHSLGTLAPILGPRGTEFELPGNM